MSPGDLKLFLYQEKIMFTSLWRHQCDHMAGFDFFLNTGHGSIFHFSYDMFSYIL